MSAFEFYFTFYGLLLGFSVAEVTAGFARSFSSRAKRSVGWLTPLLSLVILIDIMNFWLFAWASRDAVNVGWGIMMGGLFVAVTYYIAASLVYPQNPVEADELDRHYWQQKRVVIGGIAIANMVVLVFTITNAQAQIGGYGFLVWQLAYWGPLIGLVLSRRKSIDLSLLCVLIAQYFAVGLRLFSPG